MNRSPWRRKLLILLMVALLCLGLAMYTKPFSRGTAVREVLAPLQGGVVNVWHSVASTFDYVARAKNISDNNTKLQQQVRELTWQNNRMQDLASENERLMKLDAFRQRYQDNFNLLGARVISRTTSNWYSTFTIDRGSADGVTDNQAVVSDAGLVGQTVNVGPHTAEVLLILDRDGAVGAKVQENGTLGIVEGNNDEHAVLRMVHLPYDAKLQAGQVVITSGLGGIFPRGIPIGKVTKFENQGSELDKYALVQPYVDFNRLEETFIITKVKQQVP